MTALEENVNETREFSSALPLEMIDMIFSYVEDTGDIHDWYRFSLVNHSWYSAATPRLYHTFKNNGDLGDRERLWQFMRTVVEMPDLAKHVKVMNLLHCLKYSGPRSVPLAKRLCHEYLATLHRGMYESGLDYYEAEEVLNALRVDDRRPIIAIILACVTDLESLAMHVSYDDPYLRAVAENAAIPTGSDYFTNDGRKKLAFKQLKQLSLDTDDQPSWNLPLQVDRYQPFIYFPQLREMILLRAYLDPSLYSWQLSDEESTMSHLTSVTIDLHKETLLEEFLQFLDKVPSLTSLCVDFTSTPRSEWALHGPAALWNRLIEYKTTLETLDLCGAKIERNRHDTPIFCPPLKEFTKLKSLNIGTDLLLGNCRKHQAPFKLMNHVPCGLDFLGLYGDAGSDRGDWLVPDVGTQLELLAMGREPKVIHVDGYGKRCWPVLPVDKLKIVCRQKRIEYRTERLNRGGSGSEFAGSSYRHARRNSPEKDQVLLQLLEKVPLQE
ncbi:F-box protein [Aspergillus melleus]|uniref:F-box protein n=1 Tax=Aspergillus melleus TaxID=138277 RepID=UPI001E8ED338|nr:uncharacterized protein LDX57_010027 [Aspergillus melleus]KAH8432388.1 hypothetical protein LDX57_010027 [Aspergillus melleus]